MLQTGAMQKTMQMIVVLHAPVNAMKPISRGQTHRTAGPSQQSCWLGQHSLRTASRAVLALLWSQHHTKR